MASEAISTVGIVIQYKDKLTNVFTELKEVTSFTGLGGTKDMTEVTSFSSLGGYKEYIDGFKDGGEVSLEMNYTADTYKLMSEMYEASGDAGRFTFRVNIPDAVETKLEFTAYVSTAPLAGSVGDKLTSSCTLKVTGKINRYDNA